MTSLKLTYNWAIKVYVLVLFKGTAYLDPLLSAGFGA